LTFRNADFMRLEQPLAATKREITD
jgi:hypothetical protein